MGMKVGGVRKLFVPAHLAYGERAMGAHIQPHSNLHFEIELLEVLTRDD
jgi:peptidylprolyl isomerase